MEQNKSDSIYCFVCGFNFSKDLNKSITKFSTCKCCLFQYGIDDSLYGRNSIVNYRNEWIKNGLPFMGKIIDNEVWNLSNAIDQLKTLKKINLDNYPISFEAENNPNWTTDIDIELIKKAWAERR